MEFTLTPDVYAAKLSEVENEIGYPLNAAGGLIAHDGVTARYTYAEPVLTVSILHHPMMLPEAVIESKLKGWFATA